MTKPIFLWLMEPGTDYRSATAARVVSAVESWVVRRRLLRLQSADLGRIAADLITVARGSADEDVVSLVEGFLANQQSVSSYWPGDGEVRSTLIEEQFYRRFSQPMQRMLLQAAEDFHRGYTGSRPSKTGVRIHRISNRWSTFFPKNWSSHWPVADAAAKADRDEHVHRLGNLTLLTGSLNASVSNGAWLGDGGKRAALRRHDVFLLNRQVIDRSEAGWNEILIDARTNELIDAFVATWPVPDGHEGRCRIAPLASARGRSGTRICASRLHARGSVLICTEERWADARAEVLAGGQVLYEGETYSSPATAARVVRGGRSGNGWFFWKTSDGVSLNTLRDRYLAVSRAEPATWSDQDEQSCSPGHERAVTQPLRYAINVTLDGCCSHEAGLPPDSESMAFWTDELRRSDTLLYGRVTYELMEGAWRRPETGEWPGLDGRQ